jgi:integrase
MKIIEKSIGRITVPPDKDEVFVWDDELSGFGIRKKANGQASYVVRHALGRGTLGKVGFTAQGEARGRAKEVLDAAQYKRVDLLKERRREEKAKAAQMTVGEAVPRFLTAHAPGWRPRYLLEVKRHTMKRLETLHDTPIVELTRQQIGELLTEIAKKHPVDAKKVRSSLCVFLRWAADQGIAPEEWADYPPVPKVGNGGSTSRDRVLTADELVSIWRACGEDAYGRIVRLLLLTGQRRDEIGSLAWAEIITAKDGGAAIHLPKARTKNKQPHVVPLAPSATALLPDNDGSPFVFGRRGDSGFSGWSQSKARLDEIFTKIMQGTEYFLCRGVLSMKNESKVRDDFNSSIRYVSIRTVGLFLSSSTPSKLMRSSNRPVFGSSSVLNHPW